MTPSISVAVASFQNGVKWLRIKTGKIRRGSVEDQGHSILHVPHTHLCSLSLLACIFSLQTWQASADTLAPPPDKGEVFVPGT